MSADATTNIDAPATAFVGRERELRALREEFREGRRLITILGTAGTGKTRLAREVGLRTADLFREGGVWFCDLSQAEEADDVAAEVAAVLGVDLEGTASLDERRDRIATALAARGRTLVVFDNFEQISDTSDRLVGPWLDATEEAVFLVTSRERLRLADEFCFDLDPLPAEEAVELFEARAGMAATHFEVTDELYDTVERLVRHLDYLPLAIELAASRIRALPPEEMLERLSSRFRLLRSPHRDRTPRQKTLEQAIEWSWEMLDDPERSTLAQCSIFRGGFTVSFAEEVVELNSTDGEPWVVDVLERLIDKSVLERNQTQESGRKPRIEMFESIRDFVERHVEEYADPVELAERHARSYAAAGEDWLEQLDADAGGAHLSKLRDEQANLWAAFERHRDRRPALAFRIASILQKLLRYGGSGERHREVVRYMTDYSERRSQKSSQVSTFRARAELRRYRGDLEGAIEDFRRALDLFKHVDRPGLRAEILAKIAELERKRGANAAALEEIERALESARQSARSGLVRRLFAVRACCEADHGDLEAALESVGRADGFTEGDHLRDECRALKRLAYAHFYLGNYQRQRAHQERALQAAREIGDERLEAECIQGLGDAAYARGDLERAVDAYETAQEAHGRLGNRHAEGVLHGNTAAALHRLGDFEGARTCYREARSTHDSTGARPYAATATHGLGVLRHEEGSADGACRLLDEAETIWMELDAPRDAAAVALCRSLAELQRGAEEEAAAAARRALERFEASEDPLHAGLAAVCVAVANSDAEQLATAFDRALESATDEESPPRAFLAHIRRETPVLSEPTSPDGDTETPSDLESTLEKRLYGRSLIAVSERGRLPQIEGGRTSTDENPADDRPTLVVGPDANWFRFDGEEPVDLRRRGAIRRIVDALTRAAKTGENEGFDVYELFDVGWPEEEIAPDQASNRVYWAVSKIRDLGFEGHLLTSDAGYYLDRSSLALERSERERPG